MASSPKKTVSFRANESPRLYKCTFCTKTFNVHGNLIKHTRTHTGERPFRCYICEKAFANPSNLTRHKRLHTGDRPYICTFCQKTFRASSNLREHLKSHLGDSTFTCQHCESSFTVFAEYSSHMEEHFETASRLLFGSSTMALSSSVSQNTFEKKEKRNKTLKESSSLNYVSSEGIQEESSSNLKNNHVERNLERNDCKIQLDLVIPEDSSLLNSQKDLLFSVESSQNNTNCSDTSLLSSSSYQDTEVKTNANLQYSEEKDLITKVPVSKEGMEMVNYLSEHLYKAGTCIDIVDLNKEPQIQQPPTLSEIDYQTVGSSKTSLLTGRSKEKQWNFCSTEEDQSALDISKKDLENLSENVNSGYCLDFRDESTCTLDELSHKLTQCFYCQRIFSSDDQIKDCEDFSKDHPYCGTCNKTQTGSAWLLSNSTSVKKSFKCLFCQNEFTDSVELNQHSCIMDVNDKRYNQYFKNSKSTDCFAKDNVKTSTSFIDSCFEKVLLENQMDNALSSKDIQLDNVLDINTVQMDNIHGSKNSQLGIVQNCKNSQSDSIDGSNDIQLDSIQSSILDNFRDIQHMNALNELNKHTKSSVKDLSASENFYSLIKKDNMLEERLHSTATKYLKETANSPKSGDDSDKDSDDVIIVNDMLQTLSNNEKIIQDKDASSGFIFDRVHSPAQNHNYDSILLYKSSKNLNSHTEIQSSENNLTNFTSGKKQKETLNKKNKLSITGLVKNVSTKHDKKLKTESVSHPKIHKCRYCDKVFTVHGNLIKHIRIHTGEKPFHCALCTAAFANPSNLTRHVRIHTGEKPYKCTYCDRSFRDSSSLMSHHQTHLKYPLKNFSRNKKLSKNASAKPNLKINHKQKKTVDEKIEKNLSSSKVNFDSNNAKLFWPQELSSMHVKENNGLKKQSKNNQSETVDLDSFSDTESNEREVAVSSFDGPNKLIPDKIEMYKSSNSSSSSTTTTTTTITTATTGGNENSVKLSEPQKPGGLNTGLNNYSPILIECNSKNPEDLKNGNNNNSNGLKAGEILKQSNFNGSTKIIGSTSLDAADKKKCLTAQNNSVVLKPTDLNGDKSVKSKGRRLHTCSYCSKSFTVHSNLIKHIRIHTGEKPFKCQLCDKAFANPSNMTRHLRVHTIEPSYKCTACPRTFRAPNNLKVHMSLHTQSSTVQKVCFICQAVYARKKELVSHLKIHTTMENTDSDDFNSDSNECLSISLPSPTTSNPPQSIQFPFIKQGFRQKTQSGCNSSQHDGVVEISKVNVASNSLDLDNLNLKNISSNKSSSKLSGLSGKLHNSDSIEVKKVISEGFPQSDEFCELPENLNVPDAENEHFLSESPRPGLTVMDSNDNSKTSYSDVCIENVEDEESKIYSDSPVKLSKSEQVILIEERFSKNDFLTLPYGNSHIEDENGSSNCNSPYKSEEINENIQSLSSENEMHNSSSDFEMKSMKRKATKRKTHRKQHSCKFCGRGFPSRCNLIKHIRTHTGEKPFRCKCCRASFANPSNLTRHVRTHTGEKPYPCPHCPKSFRASSTLKHHIYTHAKCNSYKCRFCSKVYSIFSKFKLHLLTHTKSSAKPKCVVEDHSTPSQAFLPPVSKSVDKSSRIIPENASDPSESSHQINRYLLDQELQPSQASFIKNEEVLGFKNSKEIAFSDEVETSAAHNDLSKNSLDHYSFFSENAVSSYAGKRTGAKKQKRRVKRNNIKLNEAENKSSFWSQFPSETSTPRKRKAIHKCNYCEKAFTVSSNLRKHVRTHTGEKPFMCRFCSRPFANPSNLIRHERIHTGEKPYICNFCPQHFAASSSLKEHIKRHTAVSGNDDSLLLADIDIPNSYGMKQSSVSIVTKNDLLQDKTTELGVNIKYENDYSESEQEIIDNCLNVNTHTLELTECSSAETLEKNNESPSIIQSLLNPLTVVSNNNLAIKNIKQVRCKDEQHNGENLAGDVTSVSLALHQGLKDTEKGIKFEKEQGSSSYHSVKGSKNLSNVNDNPDISNSDCIITSMDAYSDGPSGMADRNFAESFRNISKTNTNNRNKTVQFRNSSSQKSSSEELYICKYGCKTFATYKELISHLQSHCEMKDAQADFGEGEDLNHVDSLEENMENCKADNQVLKLFLCEYGCGTYFTVDELRQHSLEVHNKPATIKNQEDRFDSESGGSNNSILKIGSPYKCSYCTKVFSIRSQLTKHIRIHTGETPHSCHYCGAGFANPSNLTRHIRTHTGEKPYNCPSCKKAFGSSSNMKEHMKTHSKLSLYNCKFCPQKFSLFQSFQQHMKCHSNVNELTDDDDNDADNNNNNNDDDGGDDDDDEEEEEKKHLNTQTVIYVEELDNINEQLADESAIVASNILNLEQQKERTEGNYKVPTAENMNLQSKEICYFGDIEEELKNINAPIYTHKKPNSSRHRKRSNKSEDHIINLVDFSLSDYAGGNKESATSSKSQSRQDKKYARNAPPKRTHITKARSLPPYVCKYCQKLFTIRSNLIKHIRTHTGERPFKCHLCEAAFANPSNLTRHVRTHTGVNKTTTKYN